MYSIGRARPDILHAHNPTMLQYGGLGRLVSGARLVVTDHGGRPHRTPRAAEWRRVDAAVAVSEVTARRSLAADHLPIRVIHNGVEPAAPGARAASRAALGLPDDAFVAVCVARLVAVKAHDVLLQAAARARGDAPVLLLVGDGPERDELQRLAARLGLARVRFLGARADVGDILAAADVAVLASRDEGLPLALLEAMAHGLPIVATTVGGVSELVREGLEGLLVPADDADALAAALGRVGGDAPLRQRLGDAAHHRVREDFSLDAAAAAYADLYRRLVSARPTS